MPKGLKAIGYQLKGFSSFSTQNSLIYVFVIQVNPTVVFLHCTADCCLVYIGQPTEQRKVDVCVLESYSNMRTFLQKQFSLLYTVACVCLSLCKYTHTHSGYS